MLPAFSFVPEQLQSFKYPSPQNQKASLRLEADSKNVFQAQC